MELLTKLSTELFIYKILLTISNIVLILFFMERLIKKFLPKKIWYFRALNLIMVLFFIAGTFISNPGYAFFHSIIALNILQYETFYLFYDKYKLHMYSFMNQFLICSSLFFYTYILYNHEEYMLLFIYIGFILTVYSAYSFNHIKMRFYKIYLSIFSSVAIMYAILFYYVLSNKSLAHLNLLIETVYVLALIGINISFAKRNKINEDAKPIKEDLRIILDEFNLLKFKHKAEEKNIDMNKYLESLLRQELEK